MTVFLCCYLMCNIKRNGAAFFSMQREQQQEQQRIDYYYDVQAGKTYC